MQMEWKSIFSHFFFNFFSTLWGKKKWLWVEKKVEEEDKEGGEEEAEEEEEKTGKEKFWMNFF